MFYPAPSFFSCTFSFLLSSLILSLYIPTPSLSTPSNRIPGMIGSSGFRHAVILDILLLLFSISYPPLLPTFPLYSLLFLLLCFDYLAEAVASPCTDGFVFLGLLHTLSFSFCTSFFARVPITSHRSWHLISLNLNLKMSQVEEHCT